MKYKIIRTDKADEQLWQILFYIADNSQSVEIALEYLDKIEKGVGRLEDFSESGCHPHYSTLKKQGYCFLVIERYIIFYKLNEVNKTVIIYAFLDSRQEYKRLL